MTTGEEEADGAAGSETDFSVLPPRRLAVLSVAALTAIFVADLMLESGIAGGVPYVAVIALSASLPCMRSTLGFAIAATALTTVGYFWSPPGGEVSKALANRGLAVFAIWITAGLVLHRKRILRAGAEAQAALQRRSEELAEWKRRYEAAVHACGGVLYDWDSATGAVIWGGAPEQVLGYTREELGNNLAWWRAQIHPDDQAIFDEQIARLVETRESARIEYRARRKDGRYITVEDHGYFIAGREADAVRMAGFVHDISDRKRAEEQIRLVVEASPIAMLLVDRQGRIVLVNSQAEKLFGYERQELLEQSVDILVPGVHRERHRDHREQFFADPRPRLLGSGRELCGLRKDGREVAIEIGVARIASESGVFVLSAIADITARKQIEQERRSQELARRLEAAQEAQRRRIARELHDELGQALTALKLDTAWMASKLLGDRTKLRRWAGTMEDRIDETIQAVRRIAAELRPAILDELGLVEAIRWQVDEFEKRTGSRCTLELPNGELGLDPDRSTATFRILQESLTNVARHADAEAVAVVLKKEARGLVLEVRDDGRGISEAAAGAPGSLGLHGMAERARLFGGALEVAEVPEGGSRVRLWLPYVEEPAANGDREERRRAAAPVVARPRQEEAEAP